MNETRTFYSATDEEVQTVVTASGTFSANTLPLHGLIRGVRIKPATSTTRYDVQLVDKDDFTIYKRVSQIGEFVEPSLGIPIRGIMTLTIDNATADEAFTVVLHADAI